MTMTEWAENEVKLAIEEGELSNEDTRYWNACAKSALKAFKELCSDEHSGYSIKLTQGILNNLINQVPLTPIEDTPKIWTRARELEDEFTKAYQCNRRFSLFKYISTDGSVKYSDIDRVRVRNVKDGVLRQDAFVSNLIDEAYPVIMPYLPESKPFVVYVENFLACPEDGDYDTYGVLYMIAPSGEKVEINRYFKDTENGTIEIDKPEYEARKEAATRWQH